MKRDGIERERDTTNTSSTARESERGEEEYKRFGISPDLYTVLPHTHEMFLACKDIGIGLVPNAYQLLLKL